MPVSFIVLLFTWNYILSVLFPFDGLFLSAHYYLFVRILFLFFPHLICCWCFFLCALLFLRWKSKVGNRRCWNNKKQRLFCYWMCIMSGALFVVQFFYYLFIQWLRIHSFADTEQLLRCSLLRSQHPDTSNNKTAREVVDFNM